MEDRERENVNNQSYTNRELYISIESNKELNLQAHQNMMEKMDSFEKTISEQLKEVIAQTKKTNGNVMDLLLWRAYVRGQTWIIPLIVASVVSGAIALTFNYFK